MENLLFLGVPILKHFGVTVYPNLLLLCSHSPNDVPPEPQRNVSIAVVRGALLPSKFILTSTSPVF